MVIIKTNKGDIKVELFDDKATGTVKNFLRYVDDEFYNSTVFHRVIRGFMIQGGGFTEDLAHKPTRDPIKNEAGNGVKNKRGTLAMARTREVDSATAQFFINTVDNAFLDYKAPNPAGFGYCVFGRVVNGMDVVDRIESLKTVSKGPHTDFPAETAEILSVERTE